MEEEDGMRQAELVGLGLFEGESKGVLEVDGDV